MNNSKFNIPGQKVIITKIIRGENSSEAPGGIFARPGDIWAVHAIQAIKEQQDKVSISPMDASYFWIDVPVTDIKLL